MLRDPIPLRNIVVLLSFVAMVCKKQEPVDPPLPEVCLDSPIGIDRAAPVEGIRLARREGKKVVPYIGVPDQYRRPKHTTLLRVRFLNGDNQTRLRVMKYAKEWTGAGAPRFAIDDASDAEIRIEFAQDGYSQTVIGKAAANVPHHHATMHFGWLGVKTPDDKFRRTVLHEFGHALGLIHEHQSANAPAIPWKRPEIYADLQRVNRWWTKERVDKNIMDRYQQGRGQYSVYDPSSIMIYPIPPKWVEDPKYATNWNTHLSATDVEWIRKHYSGGTE